MAKHRYAIIVTCEGYPDIDPIIETVSANVGKTKRFGRIGHAQRGGQPSGRDRLLALEFALKAIESLEQNQSGRVVWQKNQATFCLIKPIQTVPKSMIEPGEFSSL